MLRSFSCLFLLLTFSFLAAANTSSPLKSLNAIRQAYVQAIEEKSAAEEFDQQMENLDANQPLKLGYKGAAKTLKAKHSWNPYNKAKYLEEGMTLLGEAINDKPNDVELRFLRLSVAYYLPDFLGYDEYVKTDKHRIMNELLSGDGVGKPNDVLNVIIEFLISNDLCDQEQEQALEAMKS